MGWMTRLAVIAFAMTGGGLLFQPHRFARTPSYANLLHICSAQVWGIIYLSVAVLLASWGIRRIPEWWGVAVHTAAIMLTVGWLSAFVVRWLTDDSTTIVNVTSWTVLLILLIESAQEIDPGRVS